MKYVRFLHRDKARYGVLKDGGVREIAGELSPAWMEGRVEYTGDVFALADVSLLPPCIPGKYIGVGLNFHASADALKMAPPSEPMTFLKPSSSVIGPGGRICLPAGAEKVIFEGELAAVMGREAKRVPAENALRYVLGYTCANDVTDVGHMHTANGSTLRLKCPDTFAPIGPVIQTELNPADITISSFLNGERLQHGSTADMIFSAAEIISYLSGFLTLMPGDVISLGTPPGSAKLKDGDSIRVEIAEIGVLENEVGVG